MRRFVYIAMVLVFLGFVVSCAPTAEVTSGGGGPTMGQAQAESYNGPKARVAVTKFEVKAAKADYEIGGGLAEMLTTELFNTNRFIVLERRELHDIIKEQDLGASGRVRPNAAAPIGQIEGAELLVVGAVTAFEPNYRGAGGGLVIPGLPLGLGVGGKQAYMAIDLRVIDTRTSRILAATTVEGKSTDFGGGLGAAIGGGTTRMPFGLGGWQKTPMEKAIRVCIHKAVQFVVSRTPGRYYHYNAQGMPVSGGGGGQMQPQQPVQSSQPQQAQSASQSQADMVVVKAFKANIRKSPSTKSAIVTTAKQGAKFVVLERKGDWYHIQTESGVMGWVYKFLTRPEK